MLILTFQANIAASINCVFFEFYPTVTHKSKIHGLRENIGNQPKKCKKIFEQNICIFIPIQTKYLGTYMYLDFVALLWLRILQSFVQSSIVDVSSRPEQPRDIYLSPEKPQDSKYLDFADFGWLIFRSRPKASSNQICSKV